MKADWWLSPLFITGCLITQLNKRVAIYDLSCTRHVKKKCSANSILNLTHPCVLLQENIIWKNTCNHKKLKANFSLNSFGNYIRQHCYENNLEIFTFCLFSKKFCVSSPWISREKAIMSIMKLLLKECLLWERAQVII